MSRKELGNVLFIVSDIGQQRFELAGQHLDPQNGRLDDGLILG